MGLTGRLGTVADRVAESVAIDLRGVFREMVEAAFGSTGHFSEECHQECRFSRCGGAFLSENVLVWFCSDIVSEVTHQ